MFERRRQECDLKELTFCILGIIIIIGYFMIEYMVLRMHAELRNDPNVTTILNNTNSIAMFVAGAFFGKAVSDKVNELRGSAPQGQITTASITAGKTEVKSEPANGSLQTPQKTGD